MKTTKRTHCFASSYNVEILNSFNLDLQRKDTECAIKNKLKTLLTELRRSKFMTILVLVLKKIESEEKNESFYSQSKAEIIIN